MPGGHGGKCVGAGRHFKEATVFSGTSLTVSWSKATKQAQAVRLSAMSRCASGKTSNGNLGLS